MKTTELNTTPHLIKPPSPTVWRAALSLAVALVLSAGALFAGQISNNNIMQLITTTDLIPTGVSLNAKGKINVNLKQQGNVRNQQVQVQIVKLQPNTAYGLVAFIGEDAIGTVVASLFTDKKGAINVTYEQKSKGNPSRNTLPLPTLLDPMCDIRELNLVDGNQSTVLRGNLTNPNQGSYQVNYGMNNPGFLRTARGGVVINAGPRYHSFLLAATGLIPNTTYSLMINGEIVKAKASDKKGGLSWVNLPLWVPPVLDIQEIALTDGSGNNVVLAVGGLGVPCNAMVPTIILTSPADLATNVPISSLLTATFSEPMDPSTITNTTFVLQQGDATVGGTVIYLNGVATFTPTAVLLGNTIYTATITTGTKDLSGYPMATNFVWSFTTGAAATVTVPTVSSTTPADKTTNVPVSSQVTATFNEAMDPTTITNTTFILQQGGLSVTGLVTYASGTATFAPAIQLLGNTLYTATVTTGVTDLASNALATNVVWSFTTGATPDTTPPTVSSTTPADTTTGVPINDQVTATFSEAMIPTTFTGTTFTLQQGSISVTGTVSYLNGTATFAPATPLITNTLYTATITTGVTDLASNALAANFVWSFMTGVTPDTTAPTVSSTAPVDTSTNVPINSQVSAFFSEAMNPATFTNTTFTLQQGVTSVTGLVSYVNGTATFAPATALSTNTLYTATITTGVTDLASNALAANFFWSFTTSSSADTNPPTVVSSNPTNTSANVAINQTINATFNKNMDAFTISTANFKVTGPDGSNIVGTVGYLAANQIATFTPTTSLMTNTTYTNTIITAVKDQAGNTLSTNYVWTFTTGSLVNSNNMSIPLGAASTFAILATAATSGDANQINGDVGLSPGSSQGIPPSEINGTIHVNDQAVTDAQSSLLAAYNEAVNRSVNAISLPGNLGGLTLTPGLYVNSSSSGISGTGANAILTLDAQGDANAVFVFKMGSTLVTDGGTSIVLAGGAQAKNIYWEVASSATLGTTSLFTGNVLAFVSITVNNGTIVDGRLFAGAGGNASGAVTIQSSTVTVPAP